MALDRESKKLAKSRETTRIPLHLLVVSARNSSDPDPAWSGKRLSGGRCGGGGVIGGEIAPLPPSHVSLDTARSDGHTNSEMRPRGGGLGC